MGRFAFEAIDNEGKITSGTIDAHDEKTAISVISGRRLLVTGIKRLRAYSPIAEAMKLLQPRVSGEMLLSFTQETGALLDAGITLKSAVDGYAEDCENLRFKQVVTELCSGMSHGASLSDLMRNYPQVFPKLYVTMIRVGEMSGSLPAILLCLAEFLENAEILKNKVKAALYYPGMVLSFAVLIMTFVMMFGIPRIKQMYTGFGGHLPVPTQMLLNFGDFLAARWYVILGVCVIGYFSFMQFIKTSRGEYLFDLMKLHLPIFGSIFRRLAITRFARTLSILYSNGLPILECLQLVAESVGNRVMGDIVLGLAQHIRQGGGIAENLKQHKIFTQMSIRMISAGEASGSLSSMLGKLVRFYEAQLEISLKGLTGILEPILMVFIGIIIGAMIVALGLPFLNLMNIVQPGV